jgi:DNA mismatch repair protein MutL
MSARIHRLTSDVANKIAAGEVIQRPASAVKELVENALDGKASSVTVLITGAGKTLLQVVDDGEGMSFEDALVAFERHSTSKIRSAADLEKITTLGFRGEALASVAAVSQTELKTRRADEDLGTLVRIEGSQVREHARSSGERGTSVAVKNLYFNTPARRQFLKTDATELRNISDVVTRMALAYPEIAWKFISAGEVLLDVRPQKLEERVRSVVGDRAAASLLPVEASGEAFELAGFVGKPTYTRKTRTDQYLYLNRRPIVSRALHHAVFQAYEHLLEKGSFPFFVLFLTVNPRSVDVNVHPSKLEVKFGDESAVYRFVLTSVRRTLAAHDLVPFVAIGGEGGGSAPDTSVKLSFIPTEARSGVRAPADEGLGAVDKSDLDALFDRLGAEREGLALVPESPQPGPNRFAGRVLQHESGTGESSPGKGGRAIWQVHDKYIVSQIKTGLMIVDQHVAHERILYERALENFGNALPSSQQLLFPQTIALSPSDFALVTELMPNLERLGFDMKPFGRNTVVIEGIPADVRVGSEEKILQDLLDEFRNNEHETKMEVRDNLAKSFACKAAIKAGDRLNVAEMISLIDQLFATTMPYVCPHGRPVVLKIAIEELDRRFGRTPVSPTTR